MIPLSIRCLGSLLLLITLQAAATADTTFYDLQWKPVSRAAAAYFRPEPERTNTGYAFRDYYMSGALQCEGQYVNGESEKRDGRFRYYSQDGALTGEEYYVKGTETGTWTYFHQNKLVRSCEFVDSAGNYHCKVFDSSSGVLRREMMEKAGLSYGPCRLYSRGGRLFRIIETEKGRMHGCAQEFDTVTGRLRAEAAYLQNELVRTCEYSPGGKVTGDISYAYNRVNGLSRRWDTLTGALMATRTFLNDSMTGPALQYCKDCPFVLESFQIKNGKRHGEARTYYQCSEKLYTIRTFENGEVTGLYTSYDQETGARVVEGRDLDGNEEGEWNFYFPDGKTRRMVKNYKAGNLQGSLRTWWPSGKLRREEHYTDGKLESRKCYARDGSDTISYPRINHALFLKFPQYYFDQWLRPPPGTTGKAKLSVTVQPDKSISYARIISSDVPALNDELLRVAYSLPVSRAGGEDDMIYYSSQVLTIDLQAPSDEEEEN